MIPWLFFQSCYQLDGMTTRCQKLTNIPINTRAGGTVVAFNLTPLYLSGFRFGQEAMTNLLIGFCKITFITSQSVINPPLDFFFVVSFAGWISLMNS